MSEENKKGCACGHDHELDTELEQDIVMLEDEEGNEIPFHFITTIEHEGKEYVYLQAASNEENEEDFIEIYEIETQAVGDEEFDNLIPVEDELYDVLYNLLLKQMEVEEIDDGECECEDDSCECCKKS